MIPTAAAFESCAALHVPAYLPARFDKAQGRVLITAPIAGDGVIAGGVGYQLPAMPVVSSDRWSSCSNNPDLVAQSRLERNQWGPRAPGPQPSPMGIMGDRPCNDR
jgi:hypothetical protein